MSITLVNKTEVGDEAIMVFLDRVFEAHELGSNVQVKVTKTSKMVCPGAEMWGGPYPPRGFSCGFDAYVWLRLPSVDALYQWGKANAADAAQKAASWFERVSRHEFTHVWQLENLPHFDQPWFEGLPLNATRRTKWDNRPIEVDCNRRMYEVAAIEGTKDAENVMFWIEYLSNELLRG